MFLQQVILWRIIWDVIAELDCATLIFQYFCQVFQYKSQKFQKHILGHLQISWIFFSISSSDIFEIYFLASINSALSQTGILITLPTGQALLWEDGEYINIKVGMVDAKWKSNYLGWNQKYTFPQNRPGTGKREHNMVFHLIRRLHFFFFEVEDLPKSTFQNSSSQLQDYQLNDNGLPVFFYL